MALDGTYNVTAQTPMGPQASKLILKTAGNSLSGSSEGPMGVSEFTGGTANGDEFEFAVEAKTPMGPIKITMKGKVEGDKISGQAVTPFGPSPFSGTRA
jgi:hypothetical protein